MHSIIITITTTTDTTATTARHDALYTVRTAQLASPECEGRLAAARVGGVTRQILWAGGRKVGVIDGLMARAHAMWHVLVHGGDAPGAIGHVRDRVLGARRCGHASRHRTVGVLGEDEALLRGLRPRVVCRRPCGSGGNQSPGEDGLGLLFAKRRGREGGREGGRDRREQAVVAPGD
jgi:hypothetical protein